MKTMVVLRKFLAVGLSGILLSCNVYQKTPVSLESALQTQKPVKVATIDDDELEFRRLEMINSQLLE